jgi:hypothetical protein
MHCLSCSGVGIRQTRTFHFVMRSLGQQTHSDPTRGAKQRRDSTWNLLKFAVIASNSRENFYHEWCSRWWKKTKLLWLESSSDLLTCHITSKFKGLESGYYRATVSNSVSTDGGSPCIWLQSQRQQAQQTTRLSVHAWLWLGSCGTYIKRKRGQSTSSAIKSKRGQSTSSAIASNATTHRTLATTK